MAQDERPAANESPGANLVRRFKAHAAGARTTSAPRNKCNPLATPVCHPRDKASGKRGVAQTTQVVSFCTLDEAICPHAR